MDYINPDQNLLRGISPDDALYWLDFLVKTLSGLSEIVLLALM